MAYTQEHLADSKGQASGEFFSTSYVC